MDKTKKYTVYAHISPSGKVYIGQSSEMSVRWQGKGNRYLAKKKNGKYNQPYFANAILKYGWDNFEHKIILDKVSKNEANYAEKYLIKWYKLHNLSYNITDGGEGTCGIKRTMSPEMRKYMSYYMRTFSPLIGTHRTEKQKQSAREKMLGRKMSEKARLKMRNSHLGIPNPCRHKKVYAFDKYTKEYVKEYESLTAAANELGLSVNAVCNAAKGKCPSAGPYIWSYTPHIDKNSKLYKKMFYDKVYCYSLDGELLKVYDGASEAASAVGGNGNCIRNCCLGRALSHKGFIWKKEYQEIEPEILTKLKKRA